MSHKNSRSHKSALKYIILSYKLLVDLNVACLEVLSELGRDQSREGKEGHNEEDGLHPEN